MQTEMLKNQDLAFHLGWRSSRFVLVLTVIVLVALTINRRDNTINEFSWLFFVSLGTLLTSVLCAALTMGSFIAEQTKTNPSVYALAIRLLYCLQLVTFFTGLDCYLIFVSAAL